eukprot:415844-Hanusia_phi.AAC.3
MFRTCVICSSTDLPVLARRQGSWLCCGRYWEGVEATLLTRAAGLWTRCGEAEGFTTNGSRRVMTLRCVRLKSRTSSSSRVRWILPSSQATITSRSIRAMLGLTG